MYDGCRYDFFLFCSACPTLHVYVLSCGLYLYVWTCPVVQHWFIPIFKLSGLFCACVESLSSFLGRFWRVKWCWVCLIGVKLPVWDKFSGYLVVFVCDLWSGHVSTWFHVFVFFFVDHMLVLFKRCKREVQLDVLIEDIRKQNNTWLGKDPSHKAAKYPHYHPMSFLYRLSRFEQLRSVTLLSEIFIERFKQRKWTQNVKQIKDL